MGGSYVLVKNTIISLSELNNVMSELMVKEGLFVCLGMRL